MYFIFLCCSAIVLRFYGWCDVMNAWNVLACWFGLVCMAVKGKQWRDLII